MAGLLGQQENAGRLIYILFGVAFIFMKALLFRRIIVFYMNLSLTLLTFLPLLCWKYIRYTDFNILLDLQWTSFTSLVGASPQTGGGWEFNLWLENGTWVFIEKNVCPPREGWYLLAPSWEVAITIHTTNVTVPGMCGCNLYENDNAAWDYDNGIYSTDVPPESAANLSFHWPQKALYFYTLPTKLCTPHCKPPGRYFEHYRSIVNINRRRYAAMLSCLGQTINNMTLALRCHSFYNNSIIIYSSE